MKIRLVALLAALLSTVASAQVYNIFSPGPSGAVKSNGTYALQAELSPDIIALWTGTCSASTWLGGSGVCANPVAGANTQIQFNNSGVFGASANYTFNSATNFVGLNGYESWVDQVAPATPGSGVTLFSFPFLTSGISQPNFKDDFGGVTALGVELHMVVYNNTGGALAAGQLVYVNGSHAQVPTVALAEANSATTLPAVGFTQYSIPNNAYGEVHVFGNVTTTTTGTAVGNQLYVSDTTPGAFTTTAPTASGSFAQQIGVVTNVAGGGAGNIQLNFKTPLPGTPGTVTSITAGTGITLSPSPITGTGSVAINTAVVPQLGSANTFTSSTNTFNQIVAKSGGGFDVSVNKIVIAGNTAQWVNAAGALDTKSTECFEDTAAFTCNFNKDDGSSSTIWMTVARTGITPNTINFPTGTLQSGGSPVGVVTNGTFTITATGFSSFTGGTAQWVKVGNGANSVVSLIIPGGTGTSNANTFTINNLPAAIQPASPKYVAGGGTVTDNGTPQTNYQTLFSSNLITFLLNGSTTGWTASGTKGPSQNLSFTYSMQ